MKTADFLSLLQDHQDKSLLFEYAPNLLVGANYHITEVKHLSIDSVDCGGVVTAWKEAIVQLWENPLELGKTEFMSASKAMEILVRVGQIKPYQMDAELKIEYSNANFHTAQLFVNDYEIRGNNLMFKLAVNQTDCKAKELCGVVEPATAVQEEGCTPGGGCC